MTGTPISTLTVVAAAAVAVGVQRVPTVATTVMAERETRNWTGKSKINREFTNKVNLAVMPSYRMESLKSGKPRRSLETLSRKIMKKLKLEQNPEKMRFP